MIPAVRKQKILEILNENEIATKDQLKDALGISVSTLRRDLIELESENKVSMSHGGGVRLFNNTDELTISTKFNLNRSAKEKIAKQAASFVEDGDVIFMDPSSTTYFMIPHLVDKNVTVLTNSIKHISKLITLDIPSIMIGGTTKKNTYSCIGKIAEDLMVKFNFSKCFLGANGLSIDSGITNHDINEQTIKKIAITQSNQTYFLLDHSKYDVVTLVKITDIDSYPILTDKIPKELEKYTNIFLCK